MSVEAATQVATSEHATNELDAFINALNITDLQREMLRARWLDQVKWMGGKANQARRRYYALRLITVVGGVTVPALISVSLSNAEPAWRWATFVISLVVAIAASVEGLFQYGDRWRHFRRNSEILKSEGWQYLLGVGPYRKLTNPQDAYRAFTGRVEAILQEDVQGYMESVAQSRSEERHDIFTNL
jgi:hypothetical protein